MTAPAGGPVQDSSNMDRVEAVAEDEVTDVSGESLGSDHSPEQSVQVRVLVTGSRTWTDRGAVDAALDGLVGEFAPAGLVVVHGACPRGADRLAAEWAAERGVTVEPHPADYATHGAIAPVLRNTAMVRAGADLCVTFIEECPCPRRRRPHGTHGSVHCATEAAKAGIPVRHVRHIAGMVMEDT